jgi:hypothetical protein
MLKFLISAALSTYVTSAFCQIIDFKKTNTNVTYEASTFWLQDSGPVLGATITIRGEINRDTVTLVRRYYETLDDISRRYSEEQNIPSATTINFQLDSPGGDVGSAIELGRFVRDKQSNVLVTDNATCASACILILAGGAYRHVSGKLGIHRVFLETPSRTVTADDVKRTMTLRQEQLRAFFREMNISERLADDMMVIPSSQIKWLSARDIETYGLGVDDPVIQETKILINAKKYGLSRMEYERRWQLVRQLCIIGTADDCEEKVMKGEYPENGWGPPVVVKQR